MKAEIERVTQVGQRRTLGPGVFNRFVVEPNDLRANSPFVLLVEDFIGPQGDFHDHPHRGLETVTLILDGAMEHGDHHGHGGVLNSGDVQWMTAGSGIIHGGRPAGGHTVHALQLWLNLPNRLRNSPPGTRIQKSGSAQIETSGDVTIRTYGAANASPWSRWPITIRDIVAKSGGDISLPIAAGERSFWYVLEGHPIIAGYAAKPGEIIWCSVLPQSIDLAIAGSDAFRIIGYSGRPIDEPVFAAGPFVAGSEGELAKAFADLRAGKVVHDGPIAAND